MGRPTTADVIEERILEREHLALRAGLANLRQSIEEAHRLTWLEMAERIARAASWVRDGLLPHAAWEEAWLYARLDHEAGTPWATRSLRFQHEQIRELALALERDATVNHERWTPEIVYRLVADLARLDAAITAHLAQEERFIQPLLDGPPNGHHAAHR